MTSSFHALLSRVGPLLSPTAPRPELHRSWILPVFSLHNRHFSSALLPLQPSPSTNSNIPSTTMADNNPRRKSKTKPSVTTTTTTTTSDDRQHDGFPDECDAEVWASFDQTFRQVQSMLDRNRVLIQQVNENHQSRLPSNMVDNVSLIQELNGNISKVVSMYSDFSSDFSTVFHNNKPRNGKRGSSNQDA